MNNTTNDGDIPDGPAVKAAIPILFVNDFAETIAEYQTAFGFHLDFEHPGYYASLSRNGASVHMRSLGHGVVHNRDHEPDIRTADVYIVVSNVDALHRELVASGANIVIGLETHDFGMREFYVEDTSGNRLAFAERVTSARP